MHQAMAAGASPADAVGLSRDGLSQDGLSESDFINRPPIGRDPDDAPGTIYKVWVCIEREDGANGRHEEQDAPGSAVAHFATAREAWLFAEKLNAAAVKL